MNSHGDEPASSSVQDAGEAPGEVVDRARALNSDVVILPLRRTEDGIAVYPEGSQFLAKELRALGVDAKFLDPVDSRVFVSTHSADLIALAGVYLLGVASSAGWDGIKALFRKPGRDRRIDVTYVDLGGSSETGGRQWIARGRPTDVIEAVEAIRAAAGLDPPQGEHRAGAEAASDFEEAGSDEDLLLERRNRIVNERLAAAERALRGATDALGVEAHDRALIETMARESLRAFASALNWAYDTELEGEVHARLDEAGRWVRETFGCSLTYEAGGYHQRCPVALAHMKLGFSVGGVARSTCSLCGSDISECSHRRGSAYLVPGGHKDLGWCRVCLEEKPCEHKSHLQYRVSVVSIIRRMDVDEVSVVTDPAQPDARLQSVSVSTSGLREALGDAFTPGVRVSCDRCLSPCDGLIGPDWKPQPPEELGE